MATPKQEAKLTSVGLNSSYLETFGPSAKFEENAAIINSLDFFRDGNLLVSSTNDGTLRLYDCISPSKLKTLFCKKYGINLVRFTHHSNAVICASNNSHQVGEDVIRYLSLHDNKYLRYFRGHNDKVVSLEMSPKNDMFLAAQRDGVVRLWDLNSNVCQGILKRKGRPCVSFDPQGVIFAIATYTDRGPVVKLYDLRSYEKGPFISFDKIPYTIPFEWSSMKFSGDGNNILLSTTTNVIILLDAFQGELKGLYTAFSNKAAIPIDASFSPDAKYIASGSDNGIIHIWDTTKKNQVTQWAVHTGPVQAVLWNPKRAMLASACSTLYYWTPNP